MVEAAGVEPDTRVENVQLIDSVNVRIGSISRIAKSTVRSLYSDFPEFQQLPNSTFRRSRLAKKSILKCGSSISRVLRCRKPVRQLCNKPVLQQLDSTSEQDSLGEECRTDFNFPLPAG